MKNTYKPNNEYYHDTSREFNASTRSMAQKRNQLSSSKLSDQNKSKFEHRVQKACPTNSVQAYKKQVTLLKKQLQRLQKENLKKDHRIYQIESSYSMYRQLESQLEETYRIIYMYEGKIQQLEKQLKRLQHKVADKIESNFTAQEIQNLLNEYQDDNTEMRSTIEGQNRIMMELEQRLKTIQSKYFQTSWKLSSQNRVIANPLKKKFPKLRDTIVIQQMSLSQRQKIMNELQKKYNNLNAQKSKENMDGNPKISRFSKQKLSISKFEEKQFKNSCRFFNSWQNPLSPNLASKGQSGSYNYTIEKIQSIPKVYAKQYVQDQQLKRQANKLSQQSYGAGNYKNFQNNINFSISQGGYVVSQNSGGSLTRILSKSKVISGNRLSNNNDPQALSYESKQTSSKLKTYEGGQSPLSPQSRIIRVSRQKIQPSSYYQNKQSATTYYQGSSSMASGQPSDPGKIRYVMRQAS